MPVSPSVNIFLHKVIPDGAGLGGGSADAAFALKTINEMFLLGFSDELLAGMASSLGADCPFLSITGPCYVKEPAPPSRP